MKTTMSARQYSYVWPQIFDETASRLCSVKIKFVRDFMQESVDLELPYL